MLRATYYNKIKRRQNPKIWEEPFLDDLYILYQIANGRLHDGFQQWSLIRDPTLEGCVQYNSLAVRREWFKKKNGWCHFVFLLWCFLWLGTWNPTDAERVISPYPGTAWAKIVAMSLCYVTKRGLQGCHRFPAHNCLSGGLKKDVKRASNIRALNGKQNTRTASLVIKSLDACSWCHVQPLECCTSNLGRNMESSLAAWLSPCLLLFLYLDRRFHHVKNLTGCILQMCENLWKFFNTHVAVYKYTNTKSNISWQT